MDINVKIEAPALVDAINALAVAIAGNIEILMNLPQVAEMGGAAIAPSPVTETAKTVTEPPQTVSETSETVTDNSKSVTEDKPVVTLEQVRAKLAALSQAGKQPQVKELINKYGAKKLTEIAPEHFAAVLKEAEAV